MLRFWWFGWFEFEWVLFKIMILIPWYLQIKIYYESRFFSLIDLLRFSFDYLWVGFSKRNHVFWYSYVLIFHDMIFIQFLVFMKCLSHHPITFFLIFLMWWYEYMKYSLICFDEKVMMMNGRMKFDKLIPSWFETFMIWNYACNCFLLWWYMHIMCIMNAQNDEWLVSWSKYW